MPLLFSHLWSSDATSAVTGKKLLELTRPQVSHILRELLPRRSWSKGELLGWLIETQRRDASAKCSHTKRRLTKSRDPSL